MSTTRTVRLDRLSKARFRATNGRGATLDMGEGDSPEFTPVELLVAAIAGCSGMDVDYLTSKRAEPVSFVITASAEKFGDETGNRLRDIVVTFKVRFPEDEDGDRARAFLPVALAKSHDRLCPVSRTVQLPTPVTTQLT